MTYMFTAQHCCRSCTDEPQLLRFQFLCPFVAMLYPYLLILCPSLDICKINKQGYDFGHGNVINVVEMDASNVDQHF